MLPLRSNDRGDHLGFLAKYIISFLKALDKAGNIKYTASSAVPYHAGNSLEEREVAIEPNIVIATTTFYKNLADVRFELALRTLRNLANAGYDVVVYDGSAQSIRDAIKSCGQSILLFDEPPGSSMGHTRRLAIAKAAAVAGSNGIIGWIEPEKDFATFIQACVAPILRARDGLPGACHIVVPSRSDKLASYQEFQRYAELFGNGVFRYILGTPIDAWIGPRFFGAEDKYWFTEYRGEYGDRWDSIFIPLLRAHAAGMVLGSVEVDFAYPPEQAAAEDILEIYIRRLEQLSLVPILAQEALRLGIIEKRFEVNLKALAKTWRQALTNID